MSEVHDSREGAGNGVITNMLERRTIRRFLPDRLEGAALDIVLNAAIHAPSAGGRQGPILVACEDAELNGRLGRINRAASRERVSEGARFVSREQPSILDDPSLTSGFYDAPCVVTFFAPDDFLFSELDVACAAENLMLAAHSLGIGSCFVGRARETFESEFGRVTAAEWGIPEGYRAFAHVVMGYPATDTAPAAKPRKAGRLIRIG